MNVDSFLDDELSGQEDNNGVIDLSSSLKEIESRTNAGTINANNTTNVSLDSSKFSSFVSNPDHKHSFKDVITEKLDLIKNNVFSGNLSLAMEVYSELVLLSKEIPAEKVDVKNKLTQAVSEMHKLLHDKVVSLKTDYLKKIDLLEKLIAKISVEINNKNLQAGNELSTQLMAVFNSLNDDFLDKKTDIYIKILNLNIRLEGLKKELSDKKYSKDDAQINVILKKVEQLYVSKNFKSAIAECDKAESIYWQMPKGYLEEKLGLYREILKRKSAIELTLQISSLQKELIKEGVNPLESIVDIKKIVPSSSSSSSSSLSSSLSSSSSSVVLAGSNKLNKDINSPKITVPSSGNSKSIVDALRKINIAKIKIELLEKNYYAAEKLVSSLLDKNPNDSEVLTLKNEILLKKNKQNDLVDKTLLTGSGKNVLRNSAVKSDESFIPQLNADKFENSIGTMKDIESSLDDVESKLENGSYYIALNEMKAVEKNYALQNVMPDFDNKVNSASSSIMDVIIQKKLEQAKAFIEKSDFEQAKICVKKAMELDPTNQNALFLQRMLNPSEK